MKTEQIEKLVKFANGFEVIREKGFESSRHKSVLIEHLIWFEFEKIDSRSIIWESIYEPLFIYRVMWGINNTFPDVEIKLGKRIEVYKKEDLIISFPDTMVNRINACFTALEESENV